MVVVVAEAEADHKEQYVRILTPLPGLLEFLPLVIRH
jgi:hypothetical protein